MNIITPKNFIGQKAIVKFVFAFLITASMKSQNFHIDIGMSYRSSGNSLGAMLAPQVILSNRTHEFILGVNTQSGSNKFSGLHSGYNYVLFEGPQTLYAFYDIAYFNGCYLGKGTVKVETRNKPEYASYYQNASINVIDQHAGFGVTFIKTKHFQSFAAIGTGYSFTRGEYDQSLFRTREKNTCSLFISLGFRLKIYPDIENDIPITALRTKL